MENRLINYGKLEEREKILGIIEFEISEMGDSTYENYAKKVLLRVINTINLNAESDGV